jgi:hypothetical protein
MGAAVNGMTRRILVALASVGAVVGGAFLFACDQVYADPITAPFTTPRVDAGLTSTRVPPVPCPRSVSENAPCSRPNAVCESGSRATPPPPEEADPKCNSTFVCANDTTSGLYWTEQTAPACAGKCPADLKTIVDGAPCEIADAGGDEAELQCTTDTALCACTTGPDGAHSHPRRWVCVKPSDSGCPVKRPLLGQACFGEHVCDYGACDFKRGSQMICADEVWQFEAKQCK